MQVKFSIVMKQVFRDTKLLAGYFIFEFGSKLSHPVNKI